MIYGRYMEIDDDPFSDVKSIKRSRGEAKRHYDRISSLYDYLEGAFEERYRAIAQDQLDLRSGEKVLEIGFGTGHSLKYMVENIEGDGKVVGVDISMEMCKVSKQRLFRANLLAEAELVCADAVSLPLKADFFDKIFMSFTLELFSEDDTIMVLKEIKRTLDKKGVLCIVSLSREEEVFVELYEIFHDIFPKILDCRPIRPKKILEEQGFKVIKSIEKKMGILPIQIVVATLDRIP